MNTRHFGILAVLMAVLTVAFAISVSRVKPARPHSASVTLGDPNQPNAARTTQFALNHPFPDFVLTDLNGRRHTLKDARGSIVVLLVQGNHCPCSEAYVDRVNAIQDDYGVRGVEVWAFNPNANETEAETRAYANAHHCRYPVAYDRGGAIAGKLRAACTTEAWVADRQGYLRYHGRIDDNIYSPAKVEKRDLRDALDALLAGLPVVQPETRAFACSIRHIAQ
jgi:peroxiredoxin